MSLLVATLPSFAPTRKSVMVKRPVARVLFEELPVDSAPASEDVLPADSGDISQSSPVVFSEEKQAKEKKKRGRRKVPAPVVDTSLRRCTRSADRLYRFKHVVFQQLSLQPMKKRPRSKPMGDKAQPNSVTSQNSNFWNVILNR